MPKQAVKQEFENNSLEVAREALGKNIARWTVKDGPLVTAIPDLLLSRRSAPTQPMSHIYEPSICLMAQGSERVLLGEDLCLRREPFFGHVRGPTDGCAGYQSEAGEALPESHVET